MTEEIWKDIPGYEGLYQISTLGNVKSLRHQKVIREKLLKSASMKSGYLVVAIGSKNRKMFLVHRLVATSFIGNNENKPYVNHINGIKNDNRVENLEWCTQKENMQHASKIGSVRKGTNHHSCSLTEDQVKNIYMSSEKGAILAKKYNTSDNTIFKIRNQKSWIHITCNL